MDFVYPESMLTPRLPDEMFQEEASALSQAGHLIELIDTEVLAASVGKIKPSIDSGVTTIYRGTIEGGLCIRRVEDFLPDTELRYFVIIGKPNAADSELIIPAIVQNCASRIDSNFFSVDIIQHGDGKLRIVEIGDGQVSDLVGWSVSSFVEIWEAAK